MPNFDIETLFTTLESSTKWEAGVAFKRLTDLPIDSTSIFKSKELAETYASESAIAYPGQIIAVIETDKVTIYKINVDRSLEKIASDTDLQALKNTVDTELIPKLEAVTELITQEASTRDAADQAIDARLDIIEGEVEGSIKKAEEDAIATAKNYTDTREASILEVTAADATTKANAAETNAKAYADEIKQDLVGSEELEATFKTLKEIEEWMNGDGVNTTELTTAIAEESNTRNTADTQLAADIVTAQDTATAWWETYTPAN